MLGAGTAVSGGEELGNALERVFRQHVCAHGSRARLQPPSLLVSYQTLGPGHYKLEPRGARRKILSSTGIIEQRHVTAKSHRKLSEIGAHHLEPVLHCAPGQRRLVIKPRSGH